MIIDELPTWEPRRASRIQRRHELYRDRYQGANWCHARRLLRGILQKHVGLPWSTALCEIQRKVCHRPGESTGEKLRGCVAHNTWLENGRILTHGSQGQPVPVEESTWAFDNVYFVYPTTLTVESIHQKPFRRPFEVPREIPLTGPLEKAMCPGDIWYRVSFSKTQIEFLKTHPSHDNSPSTEDSVPVILLKETRRATTHRKTDHEHRPRHWYWPTLLALWQTTLQQHLGKPENDVIAALAQIPQPTHSTTVNHRTARPLAETARRWILNPTRLAAVPSGDRPSWAPYRFQNGILEANPELDTVVETATVKPTVQQLGGKALRRLKNHVDGLRRRYQNAASKQVRRKLTHWLGGGLMAKVHLVFTAE